jgi:hypothetical protein
MDTHKIPSGTRCENCHHPYSFHPQGGPCKSKVCSAACKRFSYPAGKPLPPAPVDQQRLITALEDLTSVIQRAPAHTRLQTADKLAQIIKDIPVLRRAAQASDRPLRQILDDCRRPAPAPQDAEVAPDDAQHTPGPT